MLVRGREEMGQEGWAYTLEIPVNNTKVVKVGYAGHHPRELDQR